MANFEIAGRRFISHVPAADHSGTQATQLAGSIDSITEEAEAGVPDGLKLLVDARAKASNLVELIVDHPLKGIASGIHLQPTLLSPNRMGISRIKN
jgi:hypothetical protein